MVTNAIISIPHGYSLGNNPTLSASQSCTFSLFVLFCLETRICPRKMRECRTLQQPMSLSTEELGRESGLFSPGRFQEVQFQGTDAGPGSTY